MRIYPHIIIYAITIFFSIALFFIAWPRRKSPGGWYLLCHLISLIIWDAGLYLEAISTTIDTKVFWSQFSYIGFTAASPFLFLFVLSFIAQENKKLAYASLYLIIPLLITIAAWTNNWHHMLWTNFHWGSIQYNILIYDHGVFFYLHLVYIYVLVTFALGLLLINILKTKPPFRSQLTIIAVGGLFPLLSGTLYAFGLDPVPGMDTSSFGFLLTNILLTWGFSHYQLLDLIPVARDVLIKQVQDGMVVVDWKNRIVEINENAARWLGLQNRQAIGKDFHNLFPWISDLDELSVLQKPTEYQPNQSKDLFLELQVSSLQPKSGNPAGYLLLLHDVSTRKQTELKLQKANEDLVSQLHEINQLHEMLQEQASRDVLTGLYNRRLMDDSLNRLLEQSQKNHTSFSIMVMDLDHFKEVNDEFGHETGDQLLEAFGKRLLKITRNDDFVFRLGGDEILLAFPRMPIFEAEKKGHYICDTLREISVTQNGIRITRSVSIGIATYPDNGTTVKELIHQADRALYVAKDRGRNQAVLASSISNS